MAAQSLMSSSKSNMLSYQYGTTASNGTSSHRSSPSSLYTTSTLIPLPTIRESPLMHRTLSLSLSMAVAKHFSHFPNLDQLSKEVDDDDEGRGRGFKIPKFLVIGHRGSGMNVVQSSDRRMRNIKENSILSFINAAKFPVDFIEFDVQVTRDDCPIIFHDIFILSDEKGIIYEKRVTELTLSELLFYGPQKEVVKERKSLYRKTEDGKIVNWNVEKDDSLCTLQEAFQKVNPSLGFNIELKFDDYIVYQQHHLIRRLQSIFKVVSKYAKHRPIIFSTFQPDAALVMRKLQSAYPVLFLTTGGSKIYYDVRRNSLEEAIQLCLEGGLQGVISDSEQIFRNPGAVVKIKEAKLSLLTYGELNNVPEAVYLQHLMGVKGVIVDLVQEITEFVSKMIKQETVRRE